MIKPPCQHQYLKITPRLLRVRHAQSTDIPTLLPGTPRTTNGGTEYRVKASSIKNSTRYRLAARIVPRSPSQEDEIGDGHQIGKTKTKKSTRAVLLTGFLLYGAGVENTPRWIGTSGRHGTESGGPLVTLNLHVTRRYYLGEGDLVSTSMRFRYDIEMNRSSGKETRSTPISWRISQADTPIYQRSQPSLSFSGAPHMLPDTHLNPPFLRSPIF